MIYVMSDIHGNFENFESVMEQIDLKPEDRLYVLGDVIDRHPYGLLILQKIMEMGNAQMILGNHEYMMMEALGFPYKKTERKMAGLSFGNEAVDLWYSNSGDVTHYIWKCMPGKDRSDIMDYLGALPLNIDLDVNGNKFKLVHAAPVELYQEYGGGYGSEAEYAVWDRETIHRCPELGYTVIFGHTPTLHFRKSDPLEIVEYNGWIGIDCGSGWGDMSNYGYPAGRLACLRLDDMEVFYSA